MKIKNIKRAHWKQVKTKNFKAASISKTAWSKATLRLSSNQSKSSKGPSKINQLPIKMKSKKALAFMVLRLETKTVQEGISWILAKKVSEVMDQNLAKMTRKLNIQRVHQTIALMNQIHHTLKIANKWMTNNSIIK